MAVNETAMLGVIRKYGSHFYNKAALGGKLSQVTFVETTAFESMSSKDIEENSQIHFAASVSAPIFSARVSTSYSSNVQQSEEKQEQFSKSTSRTSVITYGQLYFHCIFILLTTI